MIYVAAIMASLSPIILAVFAFVSTRSNTRLTKSIEASNALAIEQQKTKTAETEGRLEVARVTAEGQVELEKVQMATGEGAQRRLGDRVEKLERERDEAHAKLSQAMSDSEARCAGRLEEVRHELVKQRNEEGERLRQRLKDESDSCSQRMTAMQAEISGLRAQIDRASFAPPRPKAKRRARA